MVAGHVDGRRHVQRAAKGQTRRPLQRHRGAFGRVRSCRRHPIRRSQLPFDVGIGRLVASRIREARRGGDSERTSVRGFSRDVPIGDRRPGRHLRLRYGPSPDFRRSSSPKQRPYALVHEPGRLGESCGPSKGRRLIGRDPATPDEWRTDDARADQRKVLSLRDLPIDERERKWVRLRAIRKARLRELGRKAKGK